MSKPSGSQTVDRALQVLDALTDCMTPPRLSDLSEAVDLNISTTSRLLASLEQKGYVRRDETDGRYRLGYKILYMANVVQEQTSLHSIGDDILQRLVDDINETSGLSILEGDHVLVVLRIACQNQLRIASPIGARSPVYCTAAGKSLLAFKPEAVIERILNLGMPRLTDLTITDPAAMREELARIRERGYALDLGEREVGLVGISVPVRRAFGNVVATCSASGSGARITEDRLPDIIERLSLAANDISFRLGWRPAGASNIETGTGRLAAVTGA